LAESFGQEEIWLGCPGIDKICRSYLDHRMADRLEDRRGASRDIPFRGGTSSHMINDLFHQSGQHENLFDFELLEWALTSSGFDDVRRISEADLLPDSLSFPSGATICSRNTSTLRCARSTRS
jgi:hypothetical protein